MKSGASGTGDKPSRARKGKKVILTRENKDESVQDYSASQKTIEKQRSTEGVKLQLKHENFPSLFVQDKSESGEEEEKIASDQN